VVVLGIVYALNRTGRVSDNDAGGIVSLLLGLLVGIGFFRDRVTSEALDQNPRSVFIPFTWAGLVAAAPWLCAAALVLGALMLLFRAG
jgi:hypothetical protein